MRAARPPGPDVVPTSRSTKTCRYGSGARRARAGTAVAPSTAEMTIDFMAETLRPALDRALRGCPTPRRIIEVRGSAPAWHHHHASAPEPPSSVLPSRVGSGPCHARRAAPHRGHTPLALRNAIRLVLVRWSNTCLFVSNTETRENGPRNRISGPRTAAALSQVHAAALHDLAVHLTSTFDLSAAVGTMALCTLSIAPRYS